MRTLLLVSTFLLAVALPAQKPWPLGCPIPTTIGNDTDVPQPFQFCVAPVTDAAGQFVFYGFCDFSVQTLAPGATVTTHWNQIDWLGQPVPPGVYIVGGEAYDIGATELALEPLGAPRVGASRSIELCARNGAGLPYLLAASFGSVVGTPLGCGVQFPLDPDWLLGESLSNPAVFPDFVGVLDGDGRTAAPAIVLPPLPFLIGLGFELAFVTIEPAAPCGFGRTSPATSVVIR